MTYSTRCEVCDVAWAMRLSEQQFINDYSKEEREQLIATYQSKIKRANVMAIFPMKMPKQG